MKKPIGLPDASQRFVPWDHDPIGKQILRAIHNAVYEVTRTLSKSSSPPHVDRHEFDLIALTDVQAKWALDNQKSFQTVDTEQMVMLLVGIMFVGYLVECRPDIADPASYIDLFNEGDAEYFQARLTIAKSLEQRSFARYSSFADVNQLRKFYSVGLSVFWSRKLLSQNLVDRGYGSDLADRIAKSIPVPKFQSSTEEQAWFATVGSIADQFRQSTASANSDSKDLEASLDRPARKLYVERDEKSQDPLSFFQNVWGPVQNFTQAEVRKSDPTLLKMLRKHCEKHNLAAETALPRPAPNTGRPRKPAPSAAEALEQVVAKREREQARYRTRR